MIGGPSYIFPGLTNLITGDILQKICAKLHADRAGQIADCINRICPQYGIDSADILHEFLANLIEETGEFTRYEENLNYSAARLHDVWRKRFPTIESAKPYEFNPKALAIKVYGNRKDLGNASAEDGFTFRGSGPIQLTGRSNFVNFGMWMAKKFQIMKTPEQWAELLRTSDEYGMHSACWVFSIAFRLNDEALRDEMKEIVLRINGGLTNYPIRIHYYELCKNFIK